jgi:hypothetical protein
VRLVRHLPVIRAVPGAYGVGFAGFTQAIPAVPPQRLKLNEPGVTSGVRGGDEGLVDQPAQNVEDLSGRHLVVGADRLGGVQVAASDKDRQPCEQAALVLEQQVIAPVHHRPKGLLAGQGSAGTHGEEPEAVVEPFRQRGQRQ